MDWSKAKNILIVAFVITNLFLIFFVSKDMFTNGDLHLVTEEYVEYVENHLKENGITIKASIPTEIISLPVIEVKYESFNSAKLADSLLEEPKMLISKDYYRSKDKKLSIEDGKRIIYISSGGNDNDYSIDEKRAKELSDEFLSTHGFLRENIHLADIYLDVNQEYDSVAAYKVMYQQTYKNRYIGESYINVYVNHRGVIAMEAMLLHLEKVQTHKKQTIPATEALLRKMNEIASDNNKAMVIANIELGYYLDPNALQAANLQSIESATVFPTWIITLDNGKIYYAEALKN